MTTTSPSAGDEAREGSSSQQPAEAGAATDSLISVPVGGDRCAVCGAPLAHDQRYCVECGTRRGAPRFSANLPSRRETASPPAARPSTRRPAAMLAVAAVALLLIAFGVGLLVGHDALSGTNLTVHVNGAGTSGGSGGSNPGSSSGGGSGGSGSSSNPPAPHIHFH